VYTDNIWTDVIWTDKIWTAYNADFRQRRVIECRQNMLHRAVSLLQHGCGSNWCWCSPVSVSSKIRQNYDVSVFSVKTDEYVNAGT